MSVNYFHLTNHFLHDWIMKNFTNHNTGFPSPWQYWSPSAHATITPEWKMAGISLNSLKAYIEAGYPELVKIYLRISLLVINYWKILQLAHIQRFWILRTSAKWNGEDIIISVLTPVTCMYRHIWAIPNNFLFRCFNEWRLILFEEP